MHRKRLWGLGILVLLCLYLLGTTTKASLDMGYEESLDFRFGKLEIDRYTVYNAKQGYGFVKVAYTGKAKWTSEKTFQDQKMKMIAARSSSTTNYEGMVGVSSNEKSITTKRPGTSPKSTVHYVEGTAFQVAVPNGNYQVEISYTNPTDQRYAVAGKINGQQVFNGTTIKARKDAVQTVEYAVVNKKLVIQLYDTKFENQVYLTMIRIKELPPQTGDGKQSIFFLGDSTTRYYPTTSNRGSLGTSFGKLLGNKVQTSSLICMNNSSASLTTTMKTKIYNYSKGGQSVKSLLNMGVVNKMLLQVSKGDHVLIFLGHNDYRSSNSEVNTCKAEFQKKIQYLIDGVKQRGAIPVLVSPTALYYYDNNGKIISKLSKCQEVLKNLANKNRIVYLGLGEAGEKYFNSIGQAKTRKMFMYSIDGKDRVHQTKYGGRIQSQLLYNLIRKSKVKQILK